MAARKPIKDVPKELRPRCLFDNTHTSGIHRATGWQLCARHLAQANGYGTQPHPTNEESTWQPPS